MVLKFRLSVKGKPGRAKGCSVDYVRINLS